MIGSYILVIKLEKDKKILVGKLGKIHFKCGFYVYIGSALNGLEQRINRYLKKTKKKHWHIDYLLDFAEVIEILYNESEIKTECEISSKLNKQLDSIFGFGCSDCRCKSHLFYGSYKKIKPVIKNLQMINYKLKKC